MKITDERQYFQKPVADQGLYSFDNEHDACGVGLVADLKNKPSHRIVEMGLTILKRLTHRGAVGSDPETGDGAGLLMSMPDEFFRRELGEELPEPGHYGVAMIFGAVGQEAQIEKIVNAENCQVINWRTVPVRPEEIGPSARRNCPLIRQLFIGGEAFKDKSIMERKLFVIRRLIEKKVSDCYICSCSGRSIVYKGLLLSGQVENFYVDLASKYFKSTLALVHQRYSTNTFPTWELAHPFRYLAHNGEINTLRGNLNHLRGREPHLVNELLGDDLPKVLPLIMEGQSDSACLDNMFELLVSCGRDLKHAMLMLMPQAWGEKYYMGRDVRAFFEYHSALMEPWDGPAAVAFSDGVNAGAMLDRNGLRPARYTLSSDDIFVLSSETGVLDINPENIVKRGRLRPGEIIYCDMENHRLVYDGEIKNIAARRQPYRRWVEENKISVHGLFSMISASDISRNLFNEQRLFAYSREDIEMILIPMAATGQESLGSMGNDAALAVLSDKTQLLFNYFKQLFAQVTNPPIDPIREALVMSLTTYIGNNANILGESPEHARLIKLPRPILTDGELNFARLIKEKGLTMKVDLDKNVPDSITTDSQKFDQIIKNLIFNASKFTDKGSIDVLIHRPTTNIDLSRSGLLAEKTIAISITDSGIGIPAEKHHEIFEAFQQADGSTSRKYGGTGLGLSISRELSKLLGGEIQLESTVGEGSSFTLYMPEDGPKIIPASEAENAVSRSLLAKSVSLKKEEEQSGESLPEVIDDFNHIRPEDNSILVIEDDPVFSKILFAQCEENGFKCFTADNGEEGLRLAMDKIPKAIILDIRLPEKNGWEVLDELKKNPNTRNIPVHVMSSEDDLEDAFLKGVVGTLNKPVSKEDLNKALNSIKSFVNRKKKTLLIVEDNEVQMKTIKKLIGNKDIKILEANSGEDAIKILKSAPLDCMILDLKLPDISGLALLDKLNEMEEIKTPPVIIYTAKDLAKDELAKLEEYSETVIVKGIKSEERLLDETALFLHKVTEKMPRPKQAMLTNLYDKDNMFKGRKVLVVDDDMRNVFALSKILKQKGVVVEKAENGKKALMYLEENNDIDLVLMDIMMPDMNGYEAINIIRDKTSKVKNHDIIIFALTAKAMKKDKEKCIEAGADDYLSKPLDTEKLFSMMRVWLYR